MMSASRAAHFLRGSWREINAWNGPGVPAAG